MMYQLKRFIPKNLVLIILVFSVSISFAQNGSDRIQLNQVGFVPNSPKLAIVTGKTGATKFYVTANDSIYYAGNLSEEKQSKNSSTITKIADFSSFKREGVYSVSVPEVGSSGDG